MRETWVPSLSLEDSLEKEMAPHSSILAWRIPRREEPGGLQSMGLQSRTGLSDFTFFHFTASIDCWWLGFKYDSPHLPHPHFPQSLLMHAAAAKSFQSCPTLCDPIYGSPPCSTVPGILQARTLVALVPPRA